MRPLPCLLVSALLVSTAAAAPDCVVTFNEIHYAPAAGGAEWVELHNQFSIPVDVGGWRLTGGMDFTIPDGTTMQPGAYLVVSNAAGNPAGALGPFTGILDNAGEELRLNTRHGRLMDRVAYDNTGAWPALPTGTTLAKSSPLSASEPPPGWAASGQAGGSPGAENFPLPTAATTAAQRIAFNAGSSWKFEPTGAVPPPAWTQYGFNDGAWSEGPGILGSANVAGTAPATTLPARTTYYFRKAFVLPPGITGAQLVLTGRLRGDARVFLDGVEVAHAPSQNGALHKLISPASLALGSHQLAVKVTADATGAGWDAALALVSADASVAAPPAMLTGPVVINEVMYHKRPQYRSEVPAAAYVENAEEFVELHNHSAADVDIGGWRLTDAVSYPFPANTIITSGSFVVVNQTQFSGSLSDGGERLRLRDAADVTVDEVAYADGGRWPDAADGGGVSLELRDPRADNAKAEAWAASNETAGWLTYTYSAPGTEPPNTNNPDNWREFLFGMLDSGEVLVDDVSVIEDPAGVPVQLIQNGGFESDTVGAPPAKWRCLGTHKLSTVVNNPDGAGKVFKIVATGEFEHTYNACSTTNAGNRVINTTKTYQISYRAKWLRGSPQLNSRLYLNRCARTTILSQPGTTGTPGAVNSRRVANIGPTADRLRHSPIIPTATVPVRISADLADPDGVAVASVLYSVNGGAWQSAGMAGENGGRWYGIVPGQADGAVVQFYIQATDAAGASSFLPAAGPNSRALFRVGDGGGAAQSVRTKIRCLMTTADANALHDPLASVSNFRWGCTVIDGERDIYYDAGVRLRAAPYGRQGPRAGWNISMGAHQPFRGVHNSIVIDGAFNMPRGDGTGWLENTIGPSVNEMLYHTIGHRSGGVPANYDDICWFQAPLTSYNRLAQLKLARFNNSYLDSIFEGGDADGSLYKQELIYYPTSTVDGNPESLKNAYNQVRDLDIKSLGPFADSYRMTYLLQNHSDRDDFSRIMAMCSAFDSPAGTLYANSFAAIDTESWMATLAMNSLTGLADTYNQGLAHNIMFYARPSDGRVMLLPWDQDHALYYATNYNIFGSGTHRAAAIVALPQNRRLMCKYLHHYCQTGFRNDYLDPFVNALSNTAQKPGYAFNFKQWITNRRASVLSQINTQHPPVAFAITTNGGNDFTVVTSSTTLAGSGWLDVHAIRLNATGETLPVTWTSGNAWQLTVPLAGGANVIALTALNLQGASVGADTITVTNNGPEAASAANLVLSEIDYHPPDPDGATLEFIELQNIGPRAVDCTGAAFTAGVLFNFPANYTIPIGGYALVVQNTAAFTARYGAGLPIAGEWSATTRLSNGGDRITFNDRASAPIKDFSYDDIAPWPTTPDGTGNTLVLVSPATNPDHALAASWRASTNAGGSPGAADPPPAPFVQPVIKVEDALLAAPQVTFSNNEARVTWTERADLNGLAVTPQLSRDLINWQSDDSLMDIVILQSDETGRRITGVLKPGAGTLFFRLLVVRP